MYDPIPDYQNDVTIQMISPFFRNVCLNHCFWSTVETLQSFMPLDQKILASWITDCLLTCWAWSPWCVECSKMKHVRALHSNMLLNQTFGLHPKIIIIKKAACSFCVSKNCDFQVKVMYIKNNKKICHSITLTVSITY